MQKKAEGTGTDGKHGELPVISQHHTENKPNLQLSKAKLKLGRIQIPLRRF